MDREIMGIALCFGMATVILGVALVNAFRRRRPFSQIVSILLAGICFSSFFLFLPCYWQLSEGELPYRVGKSVTYTLYYGLKAITGGQQLGEMEKAIFGSSFSAAFRWLYITLNYIYFVAAPLLTSTLILSLIGDLWDQFRCRFLCPGNYHVFSELNANALQLAEKLSVSRQSISKWETGTSVPDITKIPEIAKLFGVTTDYLLKDEMEAEEMAAGCTAAEAPVRRVTMEEANEFIACQERESGKIALGVLLCILSPVCLLSFGAEAAKGVLSETAAGAAGIVILLGMIAAAVALFITSGMRSEKWDFMEKEEFETEYGVEGMARERQKAMRPGFIRNITVGVVLCILSPVPLILSGLMETETVSTHMVSFLLAMVGAAVVLFIRAGMPHEALEKLLQEGDYTAEKKRSAPLKERVAAVYWTVAAAVYLAWSFMTDGWGETWIVWPVAGVLFAAVAAIIETGGRSRTRD